MNDVRAYAEILYSDQYDKRLSEACYTLAQLVGLRDRTYIVMNGVRVEVNAPREDWFDRLAIYLDPERREEYRHDAVAAAQHVTGRPISDWAI